MEEQISFPGLGIEPFHIDKTAFTIFGRGVAWYGILITCGMILAVIYALKFCAKKEKLSSDDIIDLGFYSIIFGVLGARLYYVIFEWDRYLVTSGSFGSNLLATLKNVVSIWNGGLAIYGGVIGGILTALVLSKIKKIKFIKLLDILSPCVMIGQFIGRWGNFVNMEAYGTDTTLPWRMGLYKFSGDYAYQWHYVHPCFIYESLWNFIGFIIIHNIYRKKKFDGQICSFYFIWYGFGRMLIESLRTDSLMIGPLRVSQCVGIISVILGITLLCIFSQKYRKSPETAAAESEYSPMFENKENTAEAEVTENTETVSAESSTETEKESTAPEETDGKDN